MQKLVDWCLNAKFIFTISCIPSQVQHGLPVAHNFSWVDSLAC